MKGQNGHGCHAMRDIGAQHMICMVCIHTGKKREKPFASRPSGSWQAHAAQPLVHHLLVASPD
eukprot:1696515-Prorocentrum_lima.AAC.1